MLIQFQFCGGNNYRVNCNDIINGYKIYNATTDNVCDVTSKGIREFLEEGKPSVAMPQIRFANAQDSNESGRLILTSANNITFTVEIVGGGKLQEGDLLQICVRRKYLRKKNGMTVGQWKLRRVVQREIAYEDIGKRFLPITVSLADVSAKGYWLFRNDRKARPDGSIDTLSYMYFRIKRVTKYSDDTGEECNAIFSNVEKVAKTFNPNYNQLTIK